MSSLLAPKPRIYSLERRRLVLDYVKANKMLPAKSVMKSAEGIFQTSKSTIYNWKSDFKRTNVINVNFKRNRVDDIKEADMHWLTNIKLREAPDLYLKEMVQELFLQTNHIYSESTVHRHLVKNNMTRKVLIRHANEQNDVMRAAFMEIMKSKRLFDGDFYVNQLVCVDETHSDILQLRRKRGWSRKGEYAFKYVRNLNGGVAGISAIAAITTGGMISANTYNLVTSEVFLMNLETHILPVMNAFPHPNSILVLDNAAVHSKIEITAMCEPRGILVFFLPPYSYDLNPIELAFHSAKEFLRAHYPGDNPDVSGQIPARLIEALFSITGDVAVNFFRKCHYDVHPDNMCHEDD